jgi:hypothetical protein
VRRPSAVVAALNGALVDVITRNPTIRPERLVSAHLYGHPLTPPVVRWRTFDVFHVRSTKGTEGVAGSDAFLELAQHPLLLDAVEQVLGPDFCLWGCQVFAKPAGEPLYVIVWLYVVCQPSIVGRQPMAARGWRLGDGMAVPMHQDGHYWPIRPLATCTVWVAVDRCDSTPRTVGAPWTVEHRGLAVQRMSAARMALPAVACGAERRTLCLAACCMLHAAVACRMLDVACCLVYFAGCVLCVARCTFVPQVRYGQRLPHGRASIPSAEGALFALQIGRPEPCPEPSSCPYHTHELPFRIHPCRILLSHHAVPHFFN